MILTGCLRHTCLHAPFSQADVLGHLAVRGAVPIGVRKRVRNASSCAMRGHECCGGTRHMPHRKHTFIRQALRRMRSSATRGAFGEKPPRCEVFALPAGACVRGARARVRRTGQKSVNPKFPALQRCGWPNFAEHAMGELHGAVCSRCFAIPCLLKTARLVPHVKDTCDLWCVISMQRAEIAEHHLRSMWRVMLGVDDHD